KKKSFPQNFFKWFISPSTAEEREKQYVRGRLAEAMRTTTGQVVDDQLGRAEEHWIDFVEITACTREQLGEGGAVIGRRGGRHLGSNLGEDGIIGAHPQDHAAAVEDGIVDTAHRDQVVGRGRRQRGDAVAGYYLSQVKFQFVALVQRHLHRAGHHLHAARGAGRRGDQQGQPAGREPHALGKVGDDYIVGELVGLEDA